MHEDGHRQRQLIVNADDLGLRDDCGDLIVGHARLTSFRSLGRIPDGRRARAELSP